MHVIINAIGSSGDVNPFIVIGARLRQAGHQVDFIANPHFENRVVSQGLNLLPLGTAEDYHSALKNPDLFHPRKALSVVWNLAMQVAGPSFDWIARQHTPGDTLLIGSTLAVGARLAQEKLALPLASVHLSPSLMFSAYDIPCSPGFSFPEWMPHWLKSWYITVCDRTILDPVCKPVLNDLRARLNLPPVSKVFTKWIHSPDLVICAFPDWFAAAQLDWPPQAVNAGFPLYVSEFDGALSDELEHFLEEGVAPIVVTAGTAMAFAGPSMEMGVRVAQKTGRRAVLVCDFDDQVSKKQENEVIHVRYANFQTLFKRSAMVIHHGGIGTSAMALHCGVPQLIAPFAVDQFDNARRCERLGVARMVRRRRNLDEWCAAAQLLMSSDSKQKAFEISQRLSNGSSGAKAVVDILNKHFQPLLKGKQ